MGDRIIGKHYFEGACAPDGKYNHNIHFLTFSVGIFEWVSKSGNARQGKKGKVKVRVSGPITKQNFVNVTASYIVLRLDSGNYDGPKKVRVK
jgi:hypothetical protein